MGIDLDDATSTLDVEVLAEGKRPIALGRDLHPGGDGPIAG
jgi:hypothetical protein